jgi:hypothetical protein
VIETKNGEILTMTRFGENDLLDAHDFLDQRWAELDGSAAVAESVQNVGRARQGFATGDVELMRSALALDYVAVDHRPIGFGERTVDEWLASVVELVRRSPIEWVLRTTEQRGPVSYQRVAMRPRGDREWAWEFLQVSVFGGGVCRRVENFALSDVASARRRFDELSA